MEDRASPPTGDELLAHAAFVRGLALALVGDAHEADDVVQETYLRALGRRETPIGNARAWLAGIARNVIRMRWRTRDRRARRERRAARPEDQPATVDAVARMETLRRLTRAVDALGEPSRTTLCLRYYDRLMPAEIARRQGVPVKTVKTRLWRALGRLRSAMDERHGNRRSWALLLAPLARRALLDPAPLAPGAILMSVKTKATLALSLAVLLVATLGTVWWFASPDPLRRPAARTAARGPGGPAAAPDADDPSGDARAETSASPPPGAGTTAGTESRVVPSTHESLVRLTVVDSSTGKPVPGVWIHLHRLGEQSLPLRTSVEAPSLYVERVIRDARATIRACADGDGRVEVPVEGGPYVVVVRHPRYRDLVGERFAIGRREVDSRELRLEPYPPGEREIELSGTVTDGASGRPLAQVTVTARYRDGRKVRTLSARTGADGRYVLPVPANAQLTVTLEKDGFEPGRLRIDPIHETWRDGSVTLVAAGGGPARGEGRIAGRVTDAATGRPLPATPLTLLRGLDEDGGGGIGSWGGFASGADGRFEIDLRPVDDRAERFRVVVNRPGYRAFRSEARVLMPGRTTEVSIALEPEIARTCFVGRVTDAASGEPVAGARVRTENVFGHVVGETETDATGAFRLRVRGEEDRLIVTRRGYASTKTSVRGEVRAGSGETLDCSVALRQAAARLSGVVRSASTGEPVPGVTLSLFHAPEWTGPGPVTVTDARGAYAFDVAPGRYLVLAVRDGFGPRCSRAVDVAAGGRETADIVLEETDCVLAGTVRDAATGEALPQGAKGVSVLRLARNEREELECRMAAHGGLPRVEKEGARYSVRLPPGMWLVTVAPRGYFGIRREVILVRGDRVELDLDLDPVPAATATIRGLAFRTGSREPVAGVRVEIRMRRRTVARAETDDRGRFEVRCPPGELTIRYTWLDGSEPVTRERTAAAGSGGATEVELTVE